MWNNLITSYAISKKYTYYCIFLYGFCLILVNVKYFVKGFISIFLNYIFVKAYCNHICLKCEDFEFYQFE